MSLRVYTDIEPWKEFTASYLRVREKENRVLTDEAVSELPRFKGDPMLVSEWKLRAFSSRFLIHYLKKNHPKGTTVLDIGCGNGWFTNTLAEAGFEVCGIDVNLPELEQAARVFNQQNLDFAFADIFTWQPEEQFEVAILSAVLQYFPAPQKLFARLFEANPKLQKIYILDTNFYDEAEKAAAKTRTYNYYAQHGEAEMAKHYNHFSVVDLGPNCKKIYTVPHKVIRKLIGGSPFPIIEVTSNS